MRQDDRLDRLASLFSTMKLTVLYEDTDCLAVRKPCGMPTQPDPTGDEDALTHMQRERGEPLYLIHRLDRTVGGIVLLAKTKRAAARLSEDVREHRMEKLYLAIHAGELAPCGEMRDLLFHDKKRGKAFVVSRLREGVKEAQLSYQTVGDVFVDGAAWHLVCVRLGTGRFHQIRAQFASRACPLLGDGKYGSRIKGPLALYAVSLTFQGVGGRVTVRDLPPLDGAPWAMLEKEIVAYDTSRHEG